MQQQYFNIPVKLLIILLLSIAIPATLVAQNAAFVTKGKIEFERSVNSYVLMEKAMRFEGSENSSWRDQMLAQYKKNNPQFQLSKFTLLFNDNKSLYSPVKVDAKMGGFFDLNEIAGKNIIYKDFKNNQTTAQKSLMQNEYLITDTSRKFVWKITDEYREIAGFNCRRANGLMHDSVYVVAFYTDQIIPSGGPESFHGLPGMILGAAVPYENTTWFATKVIVENITDEQMSAPTKGKKYTFSEAVKTLRDSMKDWGGAGTFIFNRFML